MVRRVFSQEDPIGKQIKLGRPDDNVPWLTIIGVVGNEKTHDRIPRDGVCRTCPCLRTCKPGRGTSITVVMRTAGEPLSLRPPPTGGDVPPR